MTGGCRQQQRCWMKNISPPSLPKVQLNLKQTACKSQNKLLFTPYCFKFSQCMLLKTACLFFSQRCLLGHTHTQQNQNKTNKARMYSSVPIPSAKICESRLQNKSELEDKFDHLSAVCISRFTVTVCAPASGVFFLSNLS